MPGDADIPAVPLSANLLSNVASVADMNDPEQQFFEYSFNLFCCCCCCLPQYTGVMEHKVGVYGLQLRLL